MENIYENLGNPPDPFFEEKVEEVPTEYFLDVDDDDVDEEEEVTP